MAHHKALALRNMLEIKPITKTGMSMVTEEYLGSCKYSLKNRVNNSLHLYGVKKFHSLRNEFHSILNPVE